MLWTGVMLMSVLFTPEMSGACNATNNATLYWKDFNTCSQVVLRNKNIDHIVTSKESRYHRLTTLDISSNKLHILPEDFLSFAPLLKEVHLQGNTINRLPKMFLKNSTILQTFRAEGNPLSEIPASVFHETLVNLTADCHCELLSNIMMHFNGNTTKHSKLTAMCQISSEWVTVKDYHKENCGGQNLALYIVLPVLVVGLIIGGVTLYIWKWKRSSTTLQHKGAADMSPAHAPSHYTSRNTEGPTTSVSTGKRQDYENVFVGHLRTTEAKPHSYLENEHDRGTHGTNSLPEEDIYLESDVTEGDQPIYTNTQGIYYNYSQPTYTDSKNKEEDDVYILPDQ